MRRSRRQFLADMLFAGGSLGAAALAARMLQCEPPAPEPEPVVDGQTICEPAHVVVGDSEPKVIPAEPALPGMVRTCP